MTTSPLRYALAVLLAFIALNAFGGGYYGLAGAEGIPREWLAHSPFRSYFVPSLILIVAVGGGCLVASIALFARARLGRTLALLAAAIVLVWIGTQVAIIGYVSWMQPTILVAGIITFALALRLPSTGSKIPG